MMHTESDVLRVLAPAKINLTLHVTGQRADGYHLLDSLVVFAPEAADVLTLRPAEAMALQVTGPFAQGVPEDARNLCWKAATLFGVEVAMTLEKNLPHAAGIGSGSSDAAAVLRGLEQLSGRPFAGDAAHLGADVPVCLKPEAQRMTGIGEVLAPFEIPKLDAVLVNPRIEVPTGPVFTALKQKGNPPMAPLGADFIDWLSEQRNDLQAPALSVAPGIAEVLAALSGARLARMSGSGATCFGLYDTQEGAEAAADALRVAHPDWWVVASSLV